MLQLKLQAPRQSSFVMDRPRLREALSALDPVRVVLLVAPPGFGKTTLLSQWREVLKKGGCRVGWLTLDESERDAKQFLIGLIFALKSSGIDVGNLEVQAERSLQELSVDGVVRGICSTLERLKEPVAVFLDDYHRAACEDIDQLLKKILASLPTMTQFFITSRLRPEIDVPRMLAAGTAYEFSSEMLRFTSGESKLLLEPCLPSGELGQIIEQIDGWPVALQLARVLSFQESISLRSLSKLTARGGHLSTYLTEQILSGLPKESVAFLLETSILERFNTKIADQVRQRNDSWIILESLTSLQSFVTPLDDKGIWFRYHHLIAEYLKGVLNHREPGVAELLHSRASTAFEQSGHLVEAVGHARDAKDFQRCARLIEEAGGWRLVLFGGMAQLTQLLSFIPVAEKLSHPRLLVADAYLSLKAGNVERARATFNLVAGDHGTPKVNWEALSDNDRDALAVGVLIKTYEDNEIDEAYFSNFRESQSVLQDADGLVRGVLQCAGAVGALALGRFDEAEVLAREAMSAMRSVNSMLGLNYCYLHAGIACLYKGDILTAEAYLTQAQSMATENFGADSGLKAISDTLLMQLSVWKSGYRGTELAQIDQSFQHIYSYDGWFDVYAAALDTRFHVARLSGDVAAMEATIADGTELVSTRGLKRLSAIVGAQRIMKNCAISDYSSAAVDAALLAEQFPKGCWRVDSATWRPYQDVAYAIALWLAPSDPARAMELASDLIESADMFGVRLFKARALTLRASLSIGQGDMDVASADVLLAVELSYEARVLRPFLEHQQLASLISALKRKSWQTGDKPLQARFLSEISDAFANGLELPLVEHNSLSVRENEVMEQLTKGLTNKEIARCLDMTEHTVKFHLKKIFVKLGVDRRAHAISVSKKSSLTVMRSKSPVHGAPT